MAARKTRPPPLDTAGLRAELRQGLPVRIQAVLAGYAAFAATPPLGPAPADRDSDDAAAAKAVAAHHAACKAALQHAELLLRLLRWADGGPEGDDPQAEAGVAALIAQARAALGPDLSGDGDDDCEPEDEPADG